MRDACDGDHRGAERIGRALAHVSNAALVAMTVACVVLFVAAPSAWALGAVASACAWIASWDGTWIGPSGKTLAAGIALGAMVGIGVVVL